MLAHGNRLRRRCHLPHPRPRLRACKRERRFHFRIQRKILCIRQINRATRSLQVKRPLLRALQRFRNVMRVSQKKIRRIHQRVVLFFSRHRESPQRRLCKRIVHRAPLVRIIAHRAVFQILLHQQHLRPAAVKPHDARRAQLPAVQPDVVRSNPRRQPALVQKLRSPLVNLQPNLPLLRIPVQVEVPRQLLHPRRPLPNRRRTRSASLRRPLLQRLCFSLASSPAARRSKHRAHPQNTEPSLRHVRPPNLPNGFTTEILQWLICRNAGPLRIPRGHHPR